jgi:hypothetical protein
MIAMVDSKKDVGFDTDVVFLKVYSSHVRKIDCDYDLQDHRA